MSLSFLNRATDRTSPEVRRSGVPRRRGVLLINTGTPDRPDAVSVRRYLAEFLSDPLVIRLPAGLRWTQGALGRLIARARARRSAGLYRRIWTDRGSPLKVVMQDQASALAVVLPEGWRVFVAMRYGTPSIADVLAEIEAAGIEELVVVPLYPQFSRTTSGTVVRETHRALGQVGEQINVTMRTTWYDDVGYVNAQARLIAEHASSGGLSPRDTHLLFSAHGLPVSYVKRGDPYAGQVERSVKLITERLGWPAERTSLAYQSRLGPAEWLQPDTADELARLAEAGEQKVLVCPISFSADCLETLEEIGVRHRRAFEIGGGELHLCPALNAYQPFIGALKSLVLRGRQPATLRAVAKMPLLAGERVEEAADSDLDSLVMVGVSLGNKVSPRRGPRLGFSTPDQLSCVKKPQDDVHAFLLKVRAEGAADEALVWNTCHRIELYGWLANPQDAADRECVIARLRYQLLGDEPDGLAVNVLFGAEAWHHLMRTVAGLNSGLPGDKDITEQLQTAYRIAERAGTAGPRAKRLISEAAALEERLRRETAWGRFDPGYCFAALSRIRESAGLELADCRHTVIGGSTTSRSVLATLADQFEVPQRRMTLVYRGHGGGQVKLLRRAVGNGKRVRVQSYNEDAALRAIAQADVVYFGIDRDQPVLDVDALCELRDFRRHPLTIIDFNTLGSTDGVEAIEGVTVWSAKQLEQAVAAYAEAMCADRRFAEAVAEAEAWIEEQVPASVTRCPGLPCTKRGGQVRPSCRNCGIGSGRALAGSGTR